MEEVFSLVLIQSQEVVVYTLKAAGMGGGNSSTNRTMTTTNGIRSTFGVLMVL